MECWQEGGEQRKISNEWAKIEPGNDEGARLILRKLFPWMVSVKRLSQLTSPLTGA